MDLIAVEQATLALYGPSDVRWLARSPGFQDDWRPRAEELCRGFGARPADWRCPEAIFVQPLDKRRRAVVRASDLGATDDQPPVAIGFHLLIVNEADYRATGGDAFGLAAAAAPVWDRRGDLPVLSWPPPTAARSVEEVRQVLQRSDGPTLLGAAQALVDGGRVAWIRSQPETAMLKGLWTLLPASVRCELSFASFAFSNELQFHVLVLPEASKGGFDRRYLSEEQVDNYPEGRYELGVQAAAEAGDQDYLNLLFARRSRAEIWRLGWWLAGTLVVLTLASQLVKGCR